jgi:toxin ParE1/3/4
LKVVLTLAARTDIRNIALWIRRDNPRRAISFAQELRQSCDDLGRHPERFQLVAGHEDRGVRRRVHGNYLIFYRIEPNQVTVLHVLHGARDYEAVLFGDDGAD